MLDFGNCGLVFLGILVSHFSDGYVLRLRPKRNIEADKRKNNRIKMIVARNNKKYFMIDGKKDMKKYLPKEESIQEVLCQYMRLKHPDVWFRCDLAGLCLPIGQAVKVKKCTCDNGFPDFFIPTRTKNYSGLFIEIKKSYNEVYTKKGILRKTKHIREQLRCLEYLESQGFKAVFGLGLDHCIQIVEEYLKRI